MRPLLHLGRKRTGQSLTAVGNFGQKVSRLFFITDKPTGHQFLVDAGAEVSVFPASHADRRLPHEVSPLQAVNRHHIATCVLCSLTQNIGLRRVFPCFFVAADVAHQILGTEFLCHFNLHASVRRRCLADSSAMLSVQGETTAGIRAFLPLCGYSSIFPKYYQAM